jgi:hypothetical protein
VSTCLPYADMIQPTVHVLFTRCWFYLVGLVSPSACLGCSLSYVILLYDVGKSCHMLYLMDMKWL